VADFMLRESKVEKRVKVDYHRYYEKVRRVELRAKTPHKKDILNGYFLSNSHSSL